jgi:opacity protein-like surface antigen
MPRDCSAAIIHGTQAEIDAMKTILLATIAAAALSLPAMAHNNANQTNVQANSAKLHQMNMRPHNAKRSQQVAPQTNGRAQNEQQSRTQNKQAQNRIRASQLDQQQIRQIQQALNKQGFDAGHVDGKWGPETDKAVKDFQQAQKMRASGKLDQQTLQALGVNVTAQGRTGQSQGASTTGQGSNDVQQHLQPRRLRRAGTSPISSSKLRKRTATKPGGPARRVLRIGPPPGTSAIGLAWQSVAIWAACPMRPKNLRSQLNFPPQIARIGCD